MTVEKSELCRKIIGFDNGERMTLVYSLVTERGELLEDKERFGASIALEETGEESVVGDISTDREKVLKLIDIMATGYVTPISLCDVVYDHLCG